MAIIFQNFLTNAKTNTSEIRKKLGKSNEDLNEINSKIMSLSKNKQELNDQLELISEEKNKIKNKLSSLSIKNDIKQLNNLKDLKINLTKENFDLKTSLEINQKSWILFRKIKQF